MNAISIPAHFDGKQIRLDKAIALEPNTQLIVTVLPDDETERQEWFLSSARNLEDAYGDNEPEYPAELIQEANPDYEGK